MSTADYAYFDDIASCVEDVYPTLYAAMSSTLRTRLINSAIGNHTSTYLEFTTYIDMMAAYVAHKYLSARAADSLSAAPAAGPVTSRKNGNVAVTYGNLMIPGVRAEDYEFTTTAPGREYLSLRARASFPILIDDCG